MTDLKARVQRGAELLDAKHPHWWRVIDLEMLHLGECEDCILGQLYGDYIRGLDMLALGSGFSTGFRTSEYEYAGSLTRAWKRLIQDRRKAWMAKHAN